MFEKLKIKHENFLTIFCFFLKNSLYFNSPILVHSGISSGELIILFLIIALASLVVVYLLGLFLAKISALFSKKKKEKARIRAFYISIICLFAHNAISSVFEISDTSLLISIVTTPFLILFLLILFIVKKHKRNNTFEDFLENSRENKEKEDVEK